MTVQEYLDLSKKNQPFIEFNGSLRCMPFYITPDSQILNSGFLEKLGETPYEIKMNDFSISIHYPGGIVRYYDNKGEILPEQVVLFGVTKDMGVRSLQTEKLDTKIHFIPTDSDSLSEEKEYLHYGDIHLEIQTTEGEMESVKDWWIGEKRG